MLNDFSTVVTILLKIVISYTNTRMNIMCGSLCKYTTKLELKVLVIAILKGCEVKAEEPNLRS